VARILGDVIVKKIGSRLWELHVPLEYRVGGADSTEIITVPKGFKTDFASIPQIFWSLAPPDGKYTGAAIVHDYLYQKKVYSRKRSDQIFLEAMKVQKVSWWRRRLMYRAVRLFGWLAWKGK